MSRDLLERFWVLFLFWALACLVGYVLAKVAL
jgi:hypothetical protein